MKLLSSRVMDAEGLIQLTTRIPRTLRQRIAAECVRTDASMQNFVRDALEQALGNRPGRRPG